MKVQTNFGGMETLEYLSQEGYDVSGAEDIGYNPCGKYIKRVVQLAPYGMVLFTGRTKFVLNYGETETQTHFVRPSLLVSGGFGSGEEIIFYSPIDKTNGCPVSCTIPLMRTHILSHSNGDITNIWVKEETGGNIGRYLFIDRSVERDKEFVHWLDELNQNEGEYKHINLLRSGPTYFLPNAEFS